MVPQSRHKLLTPSVGLLAQQGAQITHLHATCAAGLLWLSWPLWLPLAALLGRGWHLDLACWRQVGSLPAIFPPLHQ